MKRVFNNASLYLILSDEHRDLRTPWVQLASWHILTKEKLK